MNNHYHLLVETPLPNLSQGMRQLNAPYTQEFNRRPRRVGHVLQGQFKAILVEREPHLLELCRYVALNPIRAQMVEQPEDWVWSNYRARAGLEACPPFLEVTWTWEQLAVHPSTAQRRYQAFVAQGIGHDSPSEHIRGQVYLGNETFVPNIDPAHAFKNLLVSRPTRFAPGSRRFCLGTIGRHRPSPMPIGPMGIACGKSPIRSACITPLSVAGYGKWKQRVHDGKI